MIKAIIFDFGNVICTFDNMKFIKEIEKYSSCSTKELDDRIYKNSDITRRYETGQITSDEFYVELTQLADLASQDVPKAEFIKFYTDIFKPVPETFELIRTLSQSYALGLLSNTSEWDFQFGIKVIDVFPLFDHVTTSFQVGVMKPDEAIFQDMLGKLQFEPNECIYIDDIQKYSDAAIGLGIHGIHYTGHEQLVQALNRLGVDI